MKPRKKVRPQDYPQLAFRVSAETKEKLMADVTELAARYNMELKEGDCRYRKNDIIIEALKRGLNLLRKRFEE